MGMAPWLRTLFTACYSRPGSPARRPRSGPRQRCWRLCLRRLLPSSPVSARRPAPPASPRPSRSARHPMSRWASGRGRRSACPWGVGRDRRVGRRGGVRRRERRGGSDRRLRRPSGRLSRSRSLRRLRPSGRLSSEDLPRGVDLWGGVCRKAGKRDRQAGGEREKQAEYKPSWIHGGSPSAKRAMWFSGQKSGPAVVPGIIPVRAAVRNGNAGYKCGTVAYHNMMSVASLTYEFQGALARRSAVVVNGRSGRVVLIRNPCCACPHCAILGLRLARACRG